MAEWVNSVTGEPLAIQRHQGEIRPGPEGGHIAECSHCSWRGHVKERPWAAQAELDRHIARTGYRFATAQGGEPPGLPARAEGVRTPGGTGAGMRTDEAAS